MNLAIKIHDWIKIGETMAVVSKIYNNTSIPTIEIVYLNGTKAINEDAHRIEDHREFIYKGVNGGYADNYPNLSDAVRILRRGKVN